MKKKVTLLMSHLRKMLSILNLSHQKSGTSSKSLRASGKSKVHTTGGTWIREGGEEEPVNFLDPHVVKRVVGRFGSKGGLVCTETTHIIHVMVMCLYTCLYTRQYTSVYYTFIKLL